LPVPVRLEPGPLICQILPGGVDGDSRLLLFAFQLAATAFEVGGAEVDRGDRACCRGDPFLEPLDLRPGRLDVIAAGFDLFESGRSGVAPRGGSRLGLLSAELLPVLLPP